MDPKPAWYTTEFYKTLVMQILAVATTFGWVKPFDVTTITDQTTLVINSAGNIIAQVSTIVAAILALYAYVRSRTDQKIVAMNNKAEANNS